MLHVCFNCLTIYYKRNYVYKFKKIKSARHYNTPLVRKSFKQHCMLYLKFCCLFNNFQREILKLEKKHIPQNIENVRLSDTRHSTLTLTTYFKYLQLIRAFSIICDDIYLMFERYLSSDGDFLSRSQNVKYRVTTEPHSHNSSINIKRLFLYIGFPIS